MFCSLWGIYKVIIKIILKIPLLYCDFVLPLYIIYYFSFIVILRNVLYENIFVNFKNIFKKIIKNLFYYGFEII